MQDEFLEWAGFSALTLDSCGYPYGKIPILSCCAEEVDGYFGCSMSTENDLIVWRDFGFIEPDWAAVPWFRSYKATIFTPDYSCPEFKFEPHAYRATLEAVLRDPQEYEFVRPDRQPTRRYRRLVFAKVRGLAFPRALRIQLEERLVETDPLNLRRFGEVDPNIYSGLSSGFWRSQYRQFLVSPVDCLIEALANAYGLDVSRVLVEQAVRRAQAGPSCSGE